MSKVISIYLHFKGGSHGGFLTGWLIAHPNYYQLFKSAAVRNPVLDMSYMVVSTDIPDWIFACTSNVII